MKKNEKSDSFFVGEEGLMFEDLPVNGVSVCFGCLVFSYIGYVG